ncbi:hypothetical protein [Modestobacter sp. SYSU DS0290]
MTAPVEQAVAARLAELAALAEPPDGESTVSRALALARSRRRRSAAWVAGGLAVVLLLAAGASTAGTTTTEPAAARPTRSTAPPPPPPELYEAPARGSLADDEAFLAAVAELDWSLTADPAGVVIGGDPPAVPGTQRVVYAADVPGGHRWAVVLGLVGRQWAWTWFTGPRGASPQELTAAAIAMPVEGWEPLALMDASTDTGPLVVLTEPGVGAEYSPSLDRAPGGELVRDFDPLPMVDGVPLGEVRTPITWGAGEVRLSGRVLPVFPMTTGEEPAFVDFPTGPIDGTDLPPCLEQLGVDVQLSPDGHLEGWGDSPPDQLSSAEQAAREDQIAACFRAAAGER